MNKKFLLSSLFLVFTVIASAEVQADKEILEMLGKELDKLPIEELRYVDSEILKELLLAAELREVDKKILEELGEVDKLPVEKLGQTDKKILQELPDSSLVKRRCLPYKRYWGRCFGNTDSQNIHDEKLCNTIANNLETIVKVDQIGQLGSQKGSCHPLVDVKMLLNMMISARFVDIAVKELFKDERPSVINAEIGNIRSLLER